ncbi:uncharacterized protein LOC121423778 [Lytechinus variegatus]|uniref:uncharacterized protein LOC121423778 n=1 Tax=Lytechinus variegatus TaxID=7654 RepID=UPI001BB27409|nr:uncharacterized protein LOC121423778 [Lytechinus variegatus]
MQPNSIISVAVVMTLATLLTQAVCSLQFETTQDRVPAKRLFWVDKKDHPVDTDFFTVRANDAEEILDCFVEVCIADFINCAKKCLFYENGSSCLPSCRHTRSICSVQCFKRYDVEVSDIPSVH